MLYHHDYIPELYADGYRLKSISLNIFCLQICILLRRKHAEAKELAVRAIVNNNYMLMLNHPMFEEKIS